MSGLMRLEETHKRMVELWIRGVNREQIARECGVGRATIYVWMKDPLILGYKERLEADIENRRRMRLVPTVLATIDTAEKALALVQQSIAEATTQLASQDPAERVKAPALSTLVSAAEKLANVAETLHRMERIDSGNPTQITKTETTESPRRQPQTMLEKLLTRAVEEDDEEPVTIEIEAKT
jgi:hypothetical protein